MDATLQGLTGNRFHDGTSRTPDGEIDVRATIGPDAFDRLPARVRARFSRHGPGHAPIVYRGLMHNVASTWLGYVVALATRIAGNPVVTGTGRNVPCTVTLTPDALLGGTIWHRCYRFARRIETAATTKRRGRDGGPVESFSGHFGMTLDIREVAGQLHFITDRYFVEWRSLRICLPGFASPGRLTVIHADEEDGWFRFTMTLQHRLFGVLLHQDGLFYDPED